MKVRIDPEDFDASPSYNEWLDGHYISENGPLKILTFDVRPSYVLHQLSFATYEAAVADYLSEHDAKLKDVVFSNFPTPIAYCFYRFENGYENELQRLYFLRDTWETIIDILHALVIAECRFKRISLVDSISFKKLLSDKTTDRLSNIRKIMDYSNSQCIKLATADIIPIDILDTMSDLNQTRNAFSHISTQSETQARAWIGESYTEVISILDDLKGLKGVSIMRYLSQIDVNTLRCEVFRGHSLTRTITKIPLTSVQVQDSQRFFRQGEILVSCADSVFSLRPLIYFHEDESGHMTKLCRFRKAIGENPNRQLEFDVLGDAVKWKENRAVFKAEFDELRSLFNLEPD